MAVLLLAVAGSGCRSAAASERQPVASPVGIPRTVLPEPSDAPSQPTAPASTATATLTPTELPTATFTAQRPSPTPCAAEVCTHAGVFVLQRPIAPPGRDTIDPTYRFGSTQGQQRDPHHGVEFLNSQGTPVLAAAAGTVVVAGDDRQTFYGPYSYFYGNLVVIEHDFPDQAVPLYTLYAHLSEIIVQTGQFVEAGQELGKVGMTGVATGSHLHFEVRLAENTYAASRNPELWLAPRLDAHGQLRGALAGRLLLPAGYRIELPSIVVERLDGPGGNPLEATYVGAYEEKALLAQPPWDESFAAGDLPAGWYRITFVQNGFQEREVQVLPGQLTVVTFDLRGP